jgi:hypothetical protein
MVHIDEVRGSNLEGIPAIMFLFPWLSSLPLSKCQDSILNQPIPVVPIFFPINYSSTAI